MKKNSILKLRLKGMSFVEVIVAIFIFSVVMFAVMMIFTNSFGGYKKADNMEKNIENAQFALNLVAKSLRTSTILDCNGGCGGVSLFDRTEIQFFDHSQGLCGKYVFSAGQLRLDTSTIRTDDASACDGLSLTDFTVQNSLVSSYVEGGFWVMKTIDDNVVPVEERMGRATIRLKVCSSQNCAGSKNDQAVLQTTVSLRDYNVVGL